MQSNIEGFDEKVYIDSEFLLEEQSSPIGACLDLEPPPLVELFEEPDYENAVVSIEINSNLRLKGNLTRFDMDEGVLGFTETRKTSPTELDFTDIKFLRIEKPYQFTLKESAEEDSLEEIIGESEARIFQVFLKDGTELTGKTYGSRVDKNGIHFYEHQKKGRKWRFCAHLFVSKSAIENYIIGEQIGGMLVRANAISQSQLNNALEEQLKARSELLGDYFLRENIISADDLVNSLARQKRVPNLKLGEVLLDEGLITDQQLQEALVVQKQRRKNSLGEILVSSKIIHRDRIQQCLAEKLGIPFINLRKFDIDANAIRTINASLAFSHKVVPLNFYEGKLVVAIEDPTNWHALDELRNSIDIKVEPIMASADDINWALNFYYTSEDLPENQFNAGQSGAAPDDDNYDRNAFTAGELESISSDAAIRIINKIIEEAHRSKTTHIHIESCIGENKVRVRFRKEGSLSVYFKFPAAFHTLFVSRVKVMARLNTTDSTTPQSGKIVFRNYGHLDIELQTSTIPVIGGNEDVILELLSSGMCKPLSATGLDSAKLDLLTDMISRPQGLLLVCGPAGSGKNDLLHSILHQLNHPDRKIWTIEDPVRITQSGVRQVEVNSKGNTSISDAVKCVFNADPDVIMISDLRGQETTDVAVEAALSGRLVMSALHTSNAVESIERILDLGIDKMDFADSLIGVLTQRLVKSLCSSCKKPYQPEKVEIEYLATEYCRQVSEGFTRKDPTILTVKKQINTWKEKFFQGEEITLYKAPGCDECSETGYRGHTGIHELLPNSHAIKSLIIKGAKTPHLRMEAIRSGVRTYKQDGIEKILLGYTDSSQIRALK